VYFSRLTLHSAITKINFFGKSRLPFLPQRTQGTQRKYLDCWIMLQLLFLCDLCGLCG
jgi:hypothetical protein